jgi:RNA polymerase sigma-70 factor (ECF subfamily)
MSADLEAADAMLVRAAQTGDRGAFERLYARYARVVRAILLGRLPAAEADDALQDVFITVLTKLGSLREPAAFSGWLARIARNRAEDLRRRSRSIVELDEEYGVPASQSDAAEAARALQAIRELPEAYRDTLMLRLVEGLTGPEIAERTGLTPGSVRVNLHRGMQMLRERLG